MMDESTKISNKQLLALRLYYYAARFTQEQGISSPCTPPGLDPEHLARWCAQNNLPLPSDYLRKTIAPADRKSPPD